MLSTRRVRTTAFALMGLAVLAFLPVPSRAQAALLLEEPYGFFGTFNPTGHNAIYFERICAETPVKLRRCQAGELGSVISRYQGIKGYDWVVLPLTPYLYSVEDTSQVSARADKVTVRKLRARYHEAHLLSLGADLQPGSLFHGGWNQIMGLSYERRIYAFRFNTTEKQDDAFIALMNERPNISHFHLFINNCSDFSRVILNFYFPHTFHRTVFPDAGMTTPKHLTHTFEGYARKHPEMQLAVFEIPQIPGSRRNSRANKGVAEILSTSYCAIPIVLINPYVAGGFFVDYLARGRYRLVPKQRQMLGPETLSALTTQGRSTENPVSAGAQVPSAAAGGSEEIKTTAADNSGLTEIKVEHEQVLSAKSQKPRPD